MGESHCVMGRRKCLCPRRSMATVDTNLHTARPCKGCSASLHSTARRCHPGTCVCPTDSRSAHCTPVPACRRCTHRRRRSSRRRRRPVRAGNLELRRTNRSYSCHRRRTHPMGGQLGHTNMCPGFVPRHRCTRPRHHRRGARSSAERHTPEHRHPVSQGDMSDTSVPECIHWKSSKTLLRCRLCCRGPGNTQYPRHTRRRCRRTGRCKRAVRPDDIRRPDSAPRRCRTTRRCSPDPFHRSPDNRHTWADPRTRCDSRRRSCRFDTGHRCGHIRPLRYSTPRHYRTTRPADNRKRYRLHHPPNQRQG